MTLTVFTTISYYSFISPPSLLSIHSSFRTPSHDTPSDDDTPSDVIIHSSTTFYYTDRLLTPIPYHPIIIRQVQDERPTLLQRHDMDTAKRNSASAALAKMARIIPTDDDIFDENQKIQLGCVDGITSAAHPDDDEGQRISNNNKGKKGGGRGEGRGSHK